MSSRRAGSNRRDDWNARERGPFAMKQPTLLFSQGAWDRAHLEELLSDRWELLHSQRSLPAAVLLPSNIHDVVANA
jgi:hypothetical protein